MADLRLQGKSVSEVCTLRSNKGRGSALPRVSHDDGFKWRCLLLITECFVGWFGARGRGCRMVKVEIQRRNGRL